MRERRSWQLRLDGRGKGGGAARAGPLPQRGPRWQAIGRPRGVGSESVPTDGERECWPSLVQGE